MMTLLLLSLVASLQVTWLLAAHLRFNAIAVTDMVISENHATLLVTSS
jgi:hypothetical protein